MAGKFGGTAISMTLKKIWREYLTCADKVIFVIFAFFALSSYTLVEFSRPPGGRVLVSVGKRRVASFSLRRDGDYTVEGALGAVVLQIRDGAVRVLDVSCPRRICCQMGWIKKSGQVIVCLPNRLIVRIGEQRGEFDAIAR